MKVLFLNPPSFEGFDGGAGSRYQARREIRSFWYPTWLAQPAALVPNSKLVDAPADDQGVEEVLALAPHFDLTVIHTSTPSLPNDAETARRMKEVNPNMLVGFVGAQAAVLPDKTLQACDAIDFVARKEFDYTIQEISQGRPLEKVDGISYRKDGRIVHNRERAPIHDMDALPHVIDVYKRDLTVENYYIGYLLHPYVSLYTGRGCTSKCTFCLWPQTIGGHVYRVRSAQSVFEEMEKAKAFFPQVKEFFFDDDTFTSDLKRAEAIARKLKTLDMTWSCNAKANVPYETLKVLKDCGLRLLLVGYESGNQTILNNIKKGIRIDNAREFSRNCRKLGIRIHGTFILGLPGETRHTIDETMRFACEIDPHTIQVSLAAPYPGTELFAQAEENGWFAPQSLVNSSGIQSAALHYKDLSAQEIFESVERFYKRFYMRPRPILRIMGDMVRDRQEMKRRLREGAEFFSFMNKRKVGVEHLLLLKLAAACGLIGAVWYALFSAYAMARFPLHEKPVEPSTGWPPLSVLKPMLGLEPDLHSNLLSLFDQQYPAYEILFGFQDPNDPAIGLVEAVRARYPQVPSQVVVVESAAGPNRKASVLAALESRARHDLLVVSDQDMRFAPIYLQCVAAPFADPQVGLVTCPYRSARIRNLAGLFEALTVNVDFIPSVLVALRLEGLSFALGATMAPRRQALRAIGGFEALQPYLADDYQLGNRILERGWRLHMSGCVVDNMLGKTSLRKYFLHQLRWGRTYRVSRPLGYFLSIIMNGTLFALLCALLFGRWKLLGWWLCLRLLVAAYHQVRLCRSLAPCKWLPWVLLKDLMGVAIWLGALFGNTVEWGGTTFELAADGQMRALDR